MFELKYTLLFYKCGGYVESSILNYITPFGFLLLFLCFMILKK